MTPICPSHPPGPTKAFTGSSLGKHPVSGVQRALPWSRVRTHTHRAHLTFGGGPQCLFTSGWPIAPQGPDERGGACRLTRSPGGPSGPGSPRRPRGPCRETAGAAGPGPAVPQECTPPGTTETLVSGPPPSPVLGVGGPLLIALSCPPHILTCPTPLPAHLQPHGARDTRGSRGAGVTLQERCRKW